MTQSWWRSAPVSTPAQAQADLDRWCVAVVRSPPPRPEHRRRAGRGRAAAGRCRSCRSRREYREQRVVSRDALVEFETNRYSVPPGHAGADGRGPRPARRAAPGDLHARRPPDRPASPRARPAPGRRSARPSTPERSSGRCSSSSPPEAVPAQAEPAARRAGAGRGGQAPRRAAPAGWSSTWSSTRGSRRWPDDERLRYCTT